MSEVLFEITKDHLETGMRGFPVGYCSTSAVDPKQGLSYRGKWIRELETWEPERAIHLLYTGKEGSAKEISEFSKHLQERSHCSQAVIQAIEQLPSQGDPMKLFSAALLILGMFELTGDYQTDSLNAIAKMPHLVASIINLHGGFGKTPLPKEEMGYMESFAHMLLTPNSDPHELTTLFRLFNILHYDHGGGNLSTFVGKAVASGLADLYNSLSSAMCALAGPRHGKANQDSLAFLKEILSQLGEDPTKGQMQEFLQNRLHQRGLIFGFGHAVLRVEDPRATILYRYGEKHYPDHPLIKIALMLRVEAVEILKQNSKIQNPYPNIDAISGAVLAAAGFDYPHYFPLLFGLSRSVGIATQIVYERTKAREGKGTPIVRPKYLYRPM